ncbi:hypothetical protein [Allopontixanthobacter sp.]|uniref:hypothetical protein n=1 Tax=Allopontixanthobacter sp. TaxID=2906452 RepID=UPI002AB98F60|nr:hypothetical protein [Allopontixanthobacter sp.]MDZ4307749.1 hypothetical protein [Allopontixanthobacter sp.]
MTEERTTRVQDPDGSTHTTTTVVTDHPERSGGGKGLMFLIAILVLAAVAYLVFSQMGGAEIAKDNAVAEAASDVGNAAQQAGDAVQDVADDVTNDE